MAASLIALVLSLLSAAILCAPPVLALRMLLLRLRRAGPQGRKVYSVLCAVAVLMLAFNLLVAIGAGRLLQPVMPGVVAGNLGTTALLFAWAAAGVCVLLAVLAPQRGRAPQV
jgi:hypothetical protein